MARNHDVLSLELEQRSSPFKLSGKFVSRASCGRTDSIRELRIPLTNMVSVIWKIVKMLDFLKSDFHQDVLYSS